MHSNITESLDCRFLNDCWQNNIKITLLREAVGLFDGLQALLVVNIMLRHLKTLLPVIFVSYLVFSPVAVNARQSLSLMIEKDDGSILIAMPVKPGELFTIRYIHSVDLSPVYEVFSVDEKKGITIKETYFKMFGAGMGHWPGRGRVVGERGWIYIKDMNIALGEFYLRIGSPSVDHTLLIRGEEIHLSRMIPHIRVRLYITQREGQENAGTRK